MSELTLADLAPLLLKTERANATVGVEQINTILYGSKKKNERRRNLIRLVATDPVLKTKDHFFQNHTQRYTNGLKKTYYFIKLIREQNITDPEEVTLMYRSLDEPVAFGLHRSLFIITLENQMNQEQKQKWLPLAKSYQILGSYAQTELGHGSNIKGIETIATYDKSTQEFIIHSPTLTSRKWWPGGLGKTGTHAIVHAQLLLNDQNCGVQAFLVQIRDLSNHIPLPGIEVGDIGPKIGFNAMDNGYLALSHVRIPRENMLMRFNQVSADGKYIHGKVSKGVYFTMVRVRALLLHYCSTTMAKATTIATRYSAVRIQGSAKLRIHPTTFKANEMQVLSYQNQQVTLFPLIGLSYACMFTHQAQSAFYESVASKLEDDNVLFLLSELHATSSGLKSLVSYMCSDGIESCRRICGGHGYSELSNLPQLFKDFVAACTYEGTFDVLVQQTARFLLKCQHLVKDNSDCLHGHDTAYLKKLTALLNPNLKCKASLQSDFLDVHLLLKAFEVRSARMIDIASSRDFCMMHATRCSVAHSELILVRNFIEAVIKHQNDALKELCTVFTLNLIIKSAGDFRHDDYVSSSQMKMCEDAFLSLLAKVRVNAVAFTDAWDFSDFELSSCLGKYDGDVYRALIAKVQEEPLNNKDVPEGYEQYLKPLFTSSL